MQLTLKDFKKHKIAVDVEPSSTVADLKQNLIDETNCLIDQIKLVFSGKVLQDAQTMEDIKINEGDSIIYMISKVKKAAPAPAPAAAPKANTAEETQAAFSTPVADAAAQPTPLVQTEGAALIAEGNPEHEARILNIMEMGYERSQVEDALYAAYDDSNRAVEYLLLGIPEDLRRTAPAAMVPTQDRANDVIDEDDTEQNMFDAAAAAAAQGQNHASNGASSQLNDLEDGGMSDGDQIQMLREALESNPELIQPLLEQLAQTNPQIAQMIQEDPGEFIRSFLNASNDDLGFAVEGDDADETEGADGQVRIQITEQDESAINRLCELGFERDLVIQIYMACDKNEEVAADILFRDS